MTRAAFAAGLPAPEVFDEVTLEGRFGIVLSRLDGPTLLQLLRPRAMTPEQAGAILAALSISVHNTPPPPDVISLRDLIRALLRSPGNLLPKHLATGVLALLESLPPGDGLCHGDLHPGNVIMTAEGPRLIDWTWRKRAGPVLDLGHCHVVLCELIPEGYPARRQGSLRTLGALAFSGLGFGCAKTPAKVGSWVPDSGIARFDDMMTFDPSGHSTRRPTCGREAGLHSLAEIRRWVLAPAVANDALFGAAQPMYPSGNCGSTAWRNSSLSRALVCRLGDLMKLPRSLAHEVPGGQLPCAARHRAKRLSFQEFRFNRPNRRHRSRLASRQAIVLTLRHLRQAPDL